MAIDHDWIHARVAAAQEGDIEAFGAVVEHLQGVIRGFVALCGAPDSEVEELAQDAFVEAYGALATYDRGRPFVTWLRGIARHVVLRRFERLSAAMRLRDERLRRHLCAVAETATASDPLADPRYDPAHLRACLERLPPAARALLLDRYQHDLDAEAIAGRSGRSGIAVRVALSRIRTTLRGCIEGRLGAAGT